MGLFSPQEAHELVITFGGGPAVLIQVSQVDDPESPSKLIPQETPYAITAAVGEFSVEESRQLQQDETLVYVSPLGLEGVEIKPGDRVVLPGAHGAVEPRNLRVVAVIGHEYPLQVVLR